MRHGVRFFAFRKNANLCGIRFVFLSKKKANRIPPRLRQKASARSGNTVAPKLLKRRRNKFCFAQTRARKKILRDDGSEVMKGAQFKVSTHKLTSARVEFGIMPERRQWKTFSSS
jgi:hypothetical protein